MNEKKKKKEVAKYLNWMKMKTPNIKIYAVLIKWYKGENI